MKQLIVQESWSEGKIFTLTGKASRYLAKVRRVSVGDELHLLCSEGVSCPAEVVSVEAGEVVLRMLDAVTGEEEAASIRLILCCALLKGKKPDTVIRRAVEAGVSSIRLFNAEHSVVVIPSDRKENRLERWQKIAVEAGQQSGNRSRVEVELFGSLEELLAVSPEAGLYCHEKDSEGGSLHRSLHGEVGKLADVCGELALFIGPEGGFCEKELALFRAKGYDRLWMGPTVLRAENAAAAALASVSILLLEKDEWCLVKKNG